MTKNTRSRAFDLADEQVWQTHDLAVAIVAEAEGGETNDGWLTIRFPVSYSPGFDPPPTMAVRGSALWPDGALGPEVPPHRVGDAFLVGFRKGSPGVAFAAPLVGGAVGAPLSRQAAQISGLRAGGPANLVAAAFAADVVVARYALRRLRDDAAPADAGAVALRLKALADAPGGDVENRIVAREAAARLDGSPSAAAELAPWLRGAITAGDVADYPGLTRLMRRLAAVPGERAATVAFLAGLIRRDAAPRAVKIAVYGTLSDPALADPSRPDDAESATILDAYATLLNDADPEVRAGAAGHLREICRKTADPAARAARTEAAIHAIVQARRGVTDEGWAGYLDQQVAMLQAA